MMGETFCGKIVDVGAKRVGGEVFFPESRRELGDAARRMLADPLQHINEIDAGIGSYGLCLW